MRPLKLHLKTTLLVSAVVVAIFSIVAYFYTRLAIGLEHKQYGERAQQIATYFADRLAARASPAGAFLAPQNESHAELLQNYGFEVTLMQVFQFHEEAGEPTAFTSSIDERSTSPGRTLSSEEIHKLVARDFPSPIVEEHPDGRFSVWALAPIILNDRLQREYVAGAVGVQVEVPASRSLAWQMTRQTIFAMALIVVGIAVTTYLLFKRLVYDPVDALLSGMTRAESGDLSVVVPPRALDEIGMLTVRFNHMVDRLREHADERTAHARQLEERVRDATSELAESNDQLVRKNVELFGIQRQLGQLERLATAGQLAAQFAHEVGTPLNLISGHVQLLRAKETDERTIKRLDTIAPTLASKHVGLVADIEPDLPDLLGDGDQLQQVFINLVNNSLDAMPDGGTLTVSAQANGSAVRVEFSDTGHGVAEADLPHLFEPLFTTKGPEKGSGLGLAVAQEIVREHGGHIEVASTPGAGTTFTLLLPLPPAEDEAGEAGDTEVTADEAQ